MKPTRRQIWQSVWVLCVIGSALFFQNCGVSRPSIENANFASAGFVHTGNETSCSACHESRRPLSTNGFTGLIAATPFDYLTHGQGVDCISCHNQSQIVRSMSDWAHGSFDHNSAMLSSCISCHTSQRPGNSAADLVLTSGFDHTTTGTTDCFGCHSATTTTTAYTSMKDWSGAVGVPTDMKWDIGHDITLAVQIPNFSGTSILSLTSQNQTIHMQMNHKTTQLTSSNLSSCSMCHTGGTYAGGLFHTSLTAAGLGQPTGCNDCHNSTVWPVGFAGPATPTVVPPRSPVSNEMQHDAVVWSKNSAGNYTAGSTLLVMNDCVVCHTAPTAAPTGMLNGWENGKYHTALTNAGASQPSSCLDCHANSRTVGSNTGTLTAFDHLTDIKGMGDCVSCHTSKTSWTLGKFHQSGLPAATSCNSCHASQRPNGTTIIASSGTSSNFTAYNATVIPFDTSSAQNSGGYHGGVRDCATCHSPTAFTTMSNWAGGNFNHAAAKLAGTLTSCQSCHLSQRPTAVITNSALNGLTAPFDHSQNGLGDCIACHSATTTRAVYAKYNTANPTSWGDTDWRGGLSYDANGFMGPDPTQVPTALNATQLNYSNAANFQVASTTAVAETLLDDMFHSSNQVPANLWTGSVVGSSLDPAKCNTCHTNLPTKYAPGKFHVAFGGPAVATNLTACTSCHINTLPTDIVGPSGKQMDHAATLSGGAVSALDCATCHLNTQAGASFNNASFHSKIGAQTASSCTICHYLIEPAGTFAFTGKSALTSGFKHASAFAPGDCVLCHSNLNTNAAITAKISSPGTVSTAWTGGLYHKNTAPASITSCSDCHIKPTTNPTTSNVDAQHMSHAANSVTATCYLCHKNDLVAGATPTTASWSKSDTFHAGTNTNTSVANTTVATCQECHGLTNGGGSVMGTNNDLPAGLTNSLNLTTFPAGNTTMYDQFIHSDVNVTGKDCVACHTNIGATGPKWKAGSFHKNVTLAATTTCVTCHTNILTYIRANGNLANGQDHSVAGIGTSDCKSCHTYPGTGVEGSATNPPNWIGASGSPTIIAFPGQTGSEKATPDYVNSTLAGNSTTPMKVVGTATTASLPHPNVGANACTVCHTTGGTYAYLTAKAYDHGAGVAGVTNLISTNCASCHEAGSSMISTPFNTSTKAGDSRPVGMTTMTVQGFQPGTCTISGSNTGVGNHFYPTDCSTCHVMPGSAIVGASTGAPTSSASPWAFTSGKHTPKGVSCSVCHANSAACKEN